MSTAAASRRSFQGRGIAQQQHAADGRAAGISVRAAPASRPPPTTSALPPAAGSHCQAAHRRASRAAATVSVFLPHSLCRRLHCWILGQLIGPAVAPAVLMFKVVPVVMKSTVETPVPAAIPRTSCLGGGWWLLLDTPRKTRCLAASSVVLKLLFIANIGRAGEVAVTIIALFACVLNIEFAITFAVPARVKRPPLR